MKKMGLNFWGLCLGLFTTQVYGQAERDEKFTDYKVNLLFGMNQPLLGGFNVEGNLFYKKLAFDYSHGISLNFSSDMLDEVNQEAGLAVHIPWTTGFGVGYRFNDWLNLRAEPKWHKFELFHDGDEQVKQNMITSYTTFSMGIGLYANLQPFKNQKNALKGIMIAPSVRWWPRVSSSLDNNEIEFYSRTMQRNVNHEALEVGIANTPLIVNVSIGYSLGLNKK